MRRWIYWFWFFSLFTQWVSYDFSDYKIPYTYIRIRVFYSWYAWSVNIYSIHSNIYLSEATTKKKWFHVCSINIWKCLHDFTQTINFNFQTLFLTEIWSVYIEHKSQLNVFIFTSTLSLNTWGNSFSFSIFSCFLLFIFRLLKLFIHHMCVCLKCDPLHIWTFSVNI